LIESLVRPGPKAKPHRGWRPRAAEQSRAELGAHVTRREPRPAPPKNPGESHAARLNPCRAAATQCQPGKTCATPRPPRGRARRQPPSSPPAVRPPHQADAAVRAADACAAHPPRPAHAGPVIPTIFSSARPRSGERLRLRAQGQQPAPGRVETGGASSSGWCVAAPACLPSKILAEPVATDPVPALLSAVSADRAGAPWRGLVPVPVCQIDLTRNHSCCV